MGAELRVIWEKTGIFFEAFACGGTRVGAKIKGSGFLKRKLPTKASL